MFLEPSRFSNVAAEVSKSNLEHFKRAPEMKR